MHERKAIKGKVAIGAAAIAISMAIAPHSAQADQAEYHLYPTPQSASYGTGSLDFEGTINTIVDKGIDAATRIRLEETAKLAKITPVPAEAPADDGEGTEILVGIEGSGGAVDKLVDKLSASGDITIQEDLFKKNDAYFLGLIPAKGDAPDRIVVIGRDADAAFYGLTTLYQVLQQDGDGRLAALALNDWADVETRGFIEGYYGNPWSTADRSELMRWGGYYKLNAYIYAPKDDPKHNAQWRSPYTSEELERTIIPLAKAGNDSKCRFVYALHPFMNDPIGFGGSYDKDLADLKAKYQQVIDAGCRQIMLSADDASNPGSQNYIKLLSDLTDWLHGLQEMKNEDGTPKYEGLSDVIPFVEADYANAGANGSWYKDLPSNVRSITTGTRVWGKADKDTISQFKRNTGVGAFMWINWPCTDNTRDHLSMAGYENALGADVEPGSLQGCVINPMQQSEPSKAGLFLNADFSWNNWESYDHADKVWNDSFSYLDNGSPNPTESSEALRTLSEHMKWYQGGGVTFESRESEQVKGMLDGFRRKLEDGSVAEGDLAQVESLFRELSRAAATYRASAANGAMRYQIEPWLGFWSDGTDAALRYIEALRGHLNGDDDKLLSQYTQGKEAFDNALLHSFPYVEDTQYARAGTRAVWPVVEALGEHLKPLAGDATGTVDVSVEVSLKGLATTNALTNLIDGERSTTTHFSGSNATTNVNPGDSFTITYEPYMTADTLTFVQSQPDDRPQDKIKDALVEYTTDGSQWHELGHLNGDPEQTLPLPGKVDVCALRFTNQEYFSGYWRVNEVELSSSASEERPFEAFASIEPSMGTTASIADGDTSRGATFQVPADGMDAGLTYKKATEVGRVGIHQGEHAKSGIIEGRVLGTWKKLGEFKAISEQTVDFEANTSVTALRLTVSETGPWDLGEISPDRLPSKVTPVTSDALGPYESFTIDKMVDGNESSYAHLKNNESNNIRSGDWVGVTFEPAKRIGKITFVQDGNGDCIAKGKVEYQNEGGQWRQVGSIDASGKQVFEFPNVNARAVRVTNLENTAKWWKINEISAESGKESAGGSIVTDVADSALSGTTGETGATMTGGQETLAPGSYAAIDLGGIKGKIEVDESFASAAHAAGLQIVHSTNALGWSVSDGGSIIAARYVGVRNAGASAVSFDFGASPLKLTFAAGSGAFIYDGSSAQGREPEKMVDGALNTYWRPTDESGSMTYLVSDPLASGKVREGIKIVSWGDPAASTVRATVYTSEDYSETKVIDLGSLTHSVMELSFPEALEARAGDTFHGVESVTMSWHGGKVPSIAEVSMLDTVSDPDNNPDEIVPTPADKTALKRAIDEASQLAEVDYTPASWAPFAAALTEANRVYVDPTASQDAVGSALEALTAARNALVRADAPVATHSVTFNFNEAGQNSTVVVVQVNDGEQVTLPTETPSVPGYRFAGWYLDAEFKRPFDPETPITADLTLYGGWFKEDGPAVPGQPSNPGQNAHPNDGIPQTGDMSAPWGLIAASGAVMAGVGVLLAHSRRKR